ncbi:MAG TPA: hypothetical protein PKY13_07540 [Microthrixaceae bacterium]|jgi:hypothetical protein|nr:hypothetical protein [Microthrixaceae bacterium]HQF93047.1 hypothetical protein [Microthrixaceae bacterium]
MTDHPFTNTPHDDEPLDEGGTWLLDLVSAVDHLRGGYRPGLTVWDALAEAAGWSADASGDGTPGATSFVLSREPARQAETQVAVRRWVTVMAERYNAGFQWPHPLHRRSFPPDRLE